MAWTTWFSSEKTRYSPIAAVKPARTEALLPFERELHRLNELWAVERFRQYSDSGNDAVNVEDVVSVAGHEEGSHSVMGRRNPSTYVHGAHVREDDVAE